MKVSRPVFLGRFHNIFGDVEYERDETQGFLFCFRTVLESGDYFYATPFVVHNPLELYYHMNNVDGVVIDKLVEQHADVVMLGYWSDVDGLQPFDSDVRIVTSFSGLYLTEEDIE